MAAKKKIVAAGIGTVILIAGALYVLPYIRVFQIITALESHDGERLGRYCDFPQLREGIKEQVRAATVSPEGAGPADKIRQGVMTQVLDRVVDQIITPEGLAKLMSQRPAEGQPPGSVNAAKASLAVLWNAHGAYGSPSEFVLTIKQDEGKPIRLLLKRTAFDWRLCRIDIPI
ncbi:MAG: hypothetical protein CSYNP_03449 [Syntrophus sp. SKADARSKE-3]|nr:hypothetical protein [Syntrophus sp. SKADARSKE-3]MDQ5987704.1 hypothetical protein [Syntrophus sp. SKADARSKE-3]